MNRFTFAMILFFAAISIPAQTIFDTIGFGLDQTLPPELLDGLDRAVIYTYVQSESLHLNPDSRVTVFIDSQGLVESIVVHTVAFKNFSDVYKLPFFDGMERETLRFQGIITDVYFDRGGVSYTLQRMHDGSFTIQAERAGVIQRE